MSHASPSLASRQTPGQGLQQQGGPGAGGPMVGGIPGGPGGGAASREEGGLNNDIMQIPQNMMMVLKQELGLGDKDFSSLNVNDKVCVFGFLFLSSFFPPGFFLLSFFSFLFLDKLGTQTFSFTLYIVVSLPSHMGFTFTPLHRFLHTWSDPFHIFLGHHHRPRKK
jgi:hypothetical protein